MLTARHRGGLMQRTARVAELFPWRISLCRNVQSGENGKPAVQHARRSSVRLARRLGLVATLSSLGIAGSVAPAFADGASGNANVTINASVPVRSITVTTPGSVTPGTTFFNNCALSGASTGATLDFPNGACSTNGAVVITNGAIAGHVDVQGADAIPSDSGQHWVLCNGPNDPACTGPSGSPAGGNYPGQNQFFEESLVGSLSFGIGGTAVIGAPLGPNPTCDLAFNSGAVTTGDCSAAIGQATTETLAMIGPSLSTDTASSWTTVWTWTAVP